MSCIVAVDSNSACIDGSRLQLNAIPAIGYSSPFLSYISAFRFGFLDRKAMVNEGYQKVMPSLNFSRTPAKLILSRALVKARLIQDSLIPAMDGVRNRC
jgi:hypothetical protein